MSNTKRLTQKQLSEILDLHGKWLNGYRGGARADLIGVDLRRASLRGVNLRNADLSGADLSGADLSRADLSVADLFRADLSGANLSGADLFRANLSGADLFRANLSGASLSGADMSGANLLQADLSEADLFRADLSGASLPSPILDLSGCTVGYKKVWNKNRTKQVVIELWFPRGTKLVSTVLGWKCRASEAMVVRCVSTGHKEETEFRSMHDRSFVYRIGETVKPMAPLNDSVAVECTSGVHFFTTREEAEEYRW